MATPDQKARVQAQFGEHAPYYTTSATHAGGESLARLVTLAQPGPDDLALDVATAAGHNALSFAAYVRHVIGLDLTREMLPAARQLAQQRERRNVSWSQGDAECLPFGDDCFDLVTCRIAPRHFPDVGLAVQEMARVCRPGGCVAICDNITPEDFDAAAYVNAFEIRRDPSHHCAYSLGEWREVIYRAGLMLEGAETLSKSFQLESWAARMNVPEERMVELRQELWHAPPLARAYFNPRTEQDSTFFDLTEGVLIGRKT